MFGIPKTILWLIPNISEFPPSFQFLTLFGHMHKTWVSQKHISVFLLIKFCTGIKYLTVTKLCVKLLKCELACLESWRQFSDPMELRHDDWIGIGQAWLASVKPCPVSSLVLCAVILSPVFWDIQKKQTNRNTCHKKVLLRERKRHTDRGVSSTPSVTRGGVPRPPPPQQGYPPPGLMGGGGTWGGVPLWQGYPWPGPMGVPKVGSSWPGVTTPARPNGGRVIPKVGSNLARVTPWQGTPPQPGPTGAGGYPRWGTPWPGLRGVPKVGYTPWQGYPPPFLTGGYQGGVPLSRGTPHLDLAEVTPPPPGVNRQTDGWTDTCQNITFPRTTYAVGKNVLWQALEKITCTLKYISRECPVVACVWQNSCCSSPSVSSCIKNHF